MGRCCHLGKENDRGLGLRRGLCMACEGWQHSKKRGTSSWATQLIPWQSCERFFLISLALTTRKHPWHKQPQSHQCSSPLTLIPIPRQIEPRHDNPKGTETPHFPHADESRGGLGQKPDKTRIVQEAAAAPALTKACTTGTSRAAGLWWEAFYG